jgi:hypothetical protein
MPIRLLAVKLMRSWALISQPGVSTERQSLFLAPYRSADRISDGGRVKGEHEGSLSQLILPLRHEAPRPTSCPPCSIMIIARWPWRVASWFAAVHLENKHCAELMLEARLNAEMIKQRILCFGACPGRKTGFQLWLNAL